MLGLVGIHIGKNITIDRSLATDEEVLAGFDDLLGEDKPPLYFTMRSARTRYRKSLTVSDITHPHSTSILSSWITSACSLGS